MQTYISLQKERLDAKVNQVELTINGDFGGATISPLLLLPLAENCFKHGTSNEPGKILIDIRFDGKTLAFRTENPVRAKKDLLMEAKGGIGIQNVEKRLGLLYPGRHKLNYEAKDGIFRLELTIRLAGSD